MRTFIAVDLPDEIKARISVLIHELKPIAPRGIGWAKIEDLHITLKFLGEIEESSLPAITDAVQTIAPDTSIFRLSVSGTGTFPPLSRFPRVLWVGIEENPALTALQSRMESALENLGFPREDRPFNPHLTVGRVKSDGVPRALFDRFAEEANTTFGRFEVPEIVVYRSLLHPGGAEHQPLLKRSLRP